MTNTLGNVTGNITYEAYGETASGDVATERKFTGQRLDETGLYFYNARYYDATIGRFISVDNIISNPVNPQCFNRYSYCLNNPLKYIDPRGLKPIGHAEREGEAYIVDEQNGKYRVIGIDGTVSGWYPSLEELREAWNGYVEQYGGEGSFVEWQQGVPYTIPVHDKDLGMDFSIVLVPEGSLWATIL